MVEKIMAKVITETPIMVWLPNEQIRQISYTITGKNQMIQDFIKEAVTEKLKEGF